MAESLSDGPPGAGDVRLRLVYSGRVQGVGFRATAAEIARRHAVRGFVRNQRDGTVELIVAGDEPEVRDFLEAVALRFERKITGIREERDETVEEFSGFEVRR